MAADSTEGSATDASAAKGSRLEALRARLATEDTQDAGKNLEDFALGGDDANVLRTPRRKYVCINLLRAVH